MTVSQCYENSSRFLFEKKSEYMWLIGQKKMAFPKTKTNPKKAEKMGLSFCMTL